MSHTQSINKHYTWEHSRFFGRRIGDPADANPTDEAPTPEELRREWGITYQRFESADDALDLRGASAQVEVRLRGALVDRFFYDEDEDAYLQTEFQVHAALAWIFTSQPTEHELARTQGLVEARRKMAGATLFPDSPFSFVVTEVV